jgi:hypothetical protein
MRSPTEPDRPLDPAGKDLLNDLLIAAHRPDPIALPPGRADEARALLSSFLIDREARAAQRRWLRGHCPRSPFRSGLDDLAVEALLERGAAGLGDEQVAALLLDPFALDGLAEVIAEAPTDLWLDAMAELGARSLALSGDRPRLSAMTETACRDLAVGIRKTGGPSPGHGRTAWELTFRDEAAQRVKRRLAEHLYGDAGREFHLWLHESTPEGCPGMLELELELSPPPRRADLTVRVVFPTGEERSFRLDVPAELRADPSAPARPRTRSGPCDALAAGAFRLSEIDVWLDEAWPPILRLRHGGTPA